MPDRIYSYEERDLAYKVLQCYDKVRKLPVSAAILCACMNKLTRGVNWTGSSKESIARCIAIQDQHMDWSPDLCDRLIELVNEFDPLNDNRLDRAQDETPTL